MEILRFLTGAFIGALLFMLLVIIFDDVDREPTDYGEITDTFTTTSNDKDWTCTFYEKAIICKQKEVDND